MYCRYCGKKLKENAVICTGCRRPVEPPRIGGSSGDSPTGPAWGVPVMAGLIFATLALPPIGLIFGFLGLRSDSKRAQGAVLMTVAVFAILFWLAIILGL